jgi:hypothetical protein
MSHDSQHSLYMHIVGAQNTQHLKVASKRIQGATLPYCTSNSSCCSWCWYRSISSKTSTSPHTPTSTSPLATTCKTHYSCESTECNTVVISWWHNSSCCYRSTSSLYNFWDQSCVCYLKSPHSRLSLALSRDHESHHGHHYHVHLVLVHDHGHDPIHHQRCWTHLLLFHCLIRTQWKVKIKITMDLSLMSSQQPALDTCKHC